MALWVQFRQMPQLLLLPPGSYTRIVRVSSSQRNTENLCCRVVKGLTHLELLYMRGLIVRVLRARPFHPTVVGHHQLELLSRLCIAAAAAAVRTPSTAKQIYGKTRIGHNPYRFTSHRIRRRG